MDLKSSIICLFAFAFLSVSFAQSIPNPQCLATNSDGVCSYCSNGYYLGGGVCMPANPFCASYDMVSGKCLSCPTGYSLLS